MPSPNQNQCSLAARKNRVVNRQQNRRRNARRQPTANRARGRRWVGTPERASPPKLRPGRQYSFAGNSIPTVPSPQKLNSTRMILNRQSPLVRGVARKPSPARASSVTDVHAVHDANRRAGRGPHAACIPALPQSCTVCSVLSLENHATIRRRNVTRPHAMMSTH